MIESHVYKVASSMSVRDFGLVSAEGEQEATGGAERDDELDAPFFPP